jgi:exodeoxyribonuclease V gamma subunit
MFLYRSNRAEVLVDELAALISKPLGSAFAPEYVVVQSKGLERWLAMELSARLGVVANARFPFPRRFTNDILAAVTPERIPCGPALPQSGLDPFEPQSLIWSILGVLPALLNLDAFKPLAHYLGREPTHQSRLCELAQRIAEVFDRYILYRPDWLADWDAGSGSDWQAVMWRAVVGQLGPCHLAARMRAALEALGDPRQRQEIGGRLPERVSVFAVSSLQPAYLRLLSALSDLIEVHVFALSPCREYWADLAGRGSRHHPLPPAPVRAATGGSPLPDATPQDGASEGAFGNRLLVSLGRLPRGFQQLLEQMGNYHESDPDLYHDPGTETMLATLQSDMLNMRVRGRRADQLPALPIKCDDRSIRFHSCHSAMREVEVLHDQLLDLFERHPDLTPDQVVVMVPDLGVYQPSIEAVFASRMGSGDAIPYAMTRSAERHHAPVVEALLGILGVLVGRFKSNQILDLLALEPIRRRFEISADALPALRSSVEGSAIRWGIDAAHRAAQGQPAQAQNTWRFGLERLWLGYALGETDAGLFQGVLPYPVSAASSAEELGKLADFVERLSELRDALGPARTLEEWKIALTGVLERFIGWDEQTGSEVHLINQALVELVARAQAAGFTGAVELETALAQLRRYLTETGRGGLFSGAVTFCALDELRAIPFRVVAMLGMNQGAGNNARPISFDRMQDAPMLGDQSDSDETRRLFLEAILSARDYLLINYIGQSVRDNSELCPAMLVDELIDILGESFYLTTDQPNPIGSARDRLVVRHPLHAFSPIYFGASSDSRLFSYSQSNCAGARALRSARSEREGFVSDGFSDLIRSRPAEPAEVDSIIELNDLIAFFANPLRWFLTRTLGVSLADSPEALGELEPVLADELERWQLGEQLLRRSLASDADGDFRAQLMASGALAPGALGACIYRGVRREVGELVKRADRWRSEPLPPLEVAVELEDAQILGVLPNLYRTGQIEVGFYRMKAARQLRVWITHLVFCRASPSPCSHQSLLICRPDNGDDPRMVRFGPVRDAEDHLRQLVHYYRLGQRYPLAFLPAVSQAYAECLSLDSAKIDAPQQAWKKARAEFQKVIEPWIGSADPYLKLAWGNDHPFEKFCRSGIDSGEPFESLAMTICAPLINHREDER